MAKYKKNQKPAMSDETIQEAEAVAKATQRPGQTNEQTKLIAQGIQKGIEQYKKQQKGKARELDKKLKKASNKTTEPDQTVEVEEDVSHKANLLPWILLVLSWAGFGAYMAFNM
jgi:hypothetical protein